MADTTQSERNFFQFDFTQIGSDWATSNHQNRGFGMRISNWGALNYGAKSPVDYTKTTLGFKAKDDLSNPRIPSFLQDAEMDKNPYVLGSTVKRARNDEFTIMGMGSRRSVSVDQPRMDVSDTNLVHKDMVVGKNYPSEGWRSFGGKYDFPVAYQG